jgi:sodium-independent sulfate anion transporter 11
MASSKPTIEERLDRVFGVKNTQPERNQAAYAASIPSSLSNADVYIEEEPTVKEYFQEITPSWQDVKHYVYRLFPFISWIGKYNLTWGLGDLIAGEFLPIYSCSSLHRDHWMLTSL